MSFSIIDIGVSGANFSRAWLDATAHNLANINTVRSGDAEPFRAWLVEARELADDVGEQGRGVTVAGVHENGDDPIRVHDPSHPLADQDGMVTMPLVDMTAEMANLIQAQRSYQLALKVVQSGQEAYQSALRIGGR